MPILVQTIHDNMLADLDAEGSDRYTFDQDTKFAINSAIGILITWFNNAFGDKKLTPEVLRELVKVKVWQASQYSRVAFNSGDVGHEFWTIFGVYPRIESNKGTSGSSTTNKSQSKFRKELSFLRSKKSAKRLNFEEWNQNSLNVFMAGNTILSGSMADYAYLDFADYSSTTYDAGGGDKVEIEIRPAIPGELVALAYLKYPNQVSLITDSIEFPKSLTELISEIALNKISYKQGDGTNLYGVTTQNINRLISLIK
jgi:hypothetical protein